MKDFSAGFTLFRVHPEFLAEIAGSWTRDSRYTGEAFDFLWKLKKEHFIFDYYSTEQEALENIEKLRPVAERLGYEEATRQAMRLSRVLADEVLFSLTFDTAAMDIDFNNRVPGPVASYTTRSAIKGNMLDMFVATADFPFWHEDDPERLLSMLIFHALQHATFPHNYVRLKLATLGLYMFVDGLPTDRVIVDVLLNFTRAFADEQENYRAMSYTKKYIGSIYHAGGRRLADRIYEDPRDIIKSYFSNFLESGKCPRLAQEPFQDILDHLETIS